MDEDSLSAATLLVPAAPASLSVIRAVAAAMAAEADLTIDDVDDVTIAVEEAALLLIDHGSAELTLSASLESRSLSVSMSGDGGASTWPPTAFDDGLAGRIIRGVVDNVVVAADEPRLTFTKTSATE